jgi:hypothetical protein
MAAKKPLEQELRRLIADWDRQARLALRKVREESLREPIAEALSMQARIFGGCINDVNDLLHGRENPCDRRGG